MSLRHVCLRLLLRAGSLVALLPGTPLASHAADWNAAQFQLYGDSYATACQDTSALRLHIRAQSLVAERAGRRIEARITDSATCRQQP